MRVVHIITGLNTGGAERALYNLLQGGMVDRFNCSVVSLMDEGTMVPQIEALGVPVTSLGMRRGVPSLSILNELRRVMQKQQPDLIQGWMYHGNLAAWLARFFSQNKPAILWNVRHSIYDLAKEKLMTRQIIRANRLFSSVPDSILYNSHVSRIQHEKFGFSSQNGQVIPNGINIRTCHPSKNARAKVRSELTIPEDALVVGHVARLHPMKDHPLFLGAAVKLADHFPTLHFLLCGRGVSFSNKRLRQLVPSHLSNRFHLLDERPDIPGLMSAMDILSSSSSYGEGFPNVLGEAMACGVPCVATDVGDSAVIVSDYGVIVPPCDEMSLIVGIERLLLLSADERSKLGSHARNHILENFALESIVKQYIALYENLISNKRKV